MKQVYFKKAQEMAKKAAYHDVKRIGKINGHVVLEPIFTDGETHVIGIPQFILYKDGKLRWTDSMEESFEIMDKFFL